MSLEEYINEIERSLTGDYLDALSLLKEIANSESQDFGFVNEITDGLIKVDERLVRLEAKLLAVKAVEGRVGRESVLIEPLSEEERRGLESSSSVISYAAGDTIFEEGDYGDSLYIIKNGKVIVLIGSCEPQVVIATLDEGDFFGEMALLTSKPSTATVRALTDTVLLKVDKDELGKILYAHPHIIRHIAKQFEARVKKLRATVGR